LNVELEIPLLTLKDQRPDLYKSKIANQAILELAFFGIEGGGLSVYSRDILPYLFLETAVTYVKPVDCEAKCTGHFELGLYDIIGPLLAAQPNYWEIGEDKAICSLIKMEIEAHPESVGWPVKVFHLSSNGTSEWFTHENSCEEEKKAEPITKIPPKIAPPQAPQPTPKRKHKPQRTRRRKRR